MPEIITELETLAELQKELANNPGLVVIKFGATWCAPCKRVDAQIKSQLAKLPANSRCFVLDIDECLDVYAFFKTKRLVSGIPSILAWYKGNTNYIPDQVVSSGDPKQIDAFFAKCLIGS